MFERYWKNRTYELKRRIKDIDMIKEAADTSSDEYYRGLVNGLETAQAIMENRMPQLKQKKEALR